MSRIFNLVIITGTCFVLCGSLAAQTVATTTAILTHNPQLAVTTPFRPTHDEMVLRYRRAARMDSLTRNVIFKSAVQAHWQPEDNTFWYCNVLKDSIREYLYVNPKKGARQPAFDGRRLAEGLQAIGISADPSRLPITDLRIFPERSLIQLKIREEWVECNLVSYTCHKMTEPLPAAGATVEHGGRERFTDPTARHWNRYEDFETGPVSPDGQWEAYIAEGNVYVKPHLAGNGGGVG